MTVLIRFFLGILSLLSAIYIFLYLIANSRGFLSLVIGIFTIPVLFVFIGLEITGFLQHVIYIFYFVIGNTGFWPWIIVLVLIMFRLNRIRARIRSPNAGRRLTSWEEEASKLISLIFRDWD